MNRYSKTKLRQGLLRRQAPAAPAPPDPAGEGEGREAPRRDVAREVQALLFDPVPPPPGPRRR